MNPCIYSYIFICIYGSMYIFIYVHGHGFIYFTSSYYRLIGIMVRVFANGPGYRGSNPGRVIPKTQNVT